MGEIISATLTAHLQMMVNDDPHTHLITQWIIIMTKPIGLQNGCYSPSSPGPAYLTSTKTYLEPCPQTLSENIEKALRSGNSDAFREMLPYAMLDF